MNISTITLAITLMLAAFVGWAYAQSGAVLTCYEEHGDIVARYSTMYAGTSEGYLELSVPSSGELTARCTFGQ